MKRLSFFGPRDALSEAVMKQFSAGGVDCRQVEPHEVDFLDKAALSGLVTSQNPDVVVVYPSWRGRGSFLDSSTADWEAMLTANVEAVTYLLQVSRQHLLTRGQGHLLVLSHLSALSPMRGLSLLATGHAALKVLVKMLALELAPHDVPVHGVAVGPEYEGLGLGSSALKRLREDRPAAQRAYQSAAELCELLVSHHLLSLTGQTLAADDGFLLTKRSGESPYAD